MRSFILTILLVALCSLALSAAMAQNPPPPPAAVAAPEECPEVRSVQTKAKVTKATTTTSVTRTQVQVQNPPPTPPARPTPQVNPVPKPGKPKIKIKVGDHNEDEDSDSDEDADPEVAVQADQTVPATSSVVVSFCGGSSNVVVRGWDRNEVHASVDGGESVELTTFGAGDTHAPASKIEVVISSGDVRHRKRSGMCHSTGDLRLDVPRSAVLDLRTNQGDIDAEDIARFRAQSMSGSVILRNIAKAIDATSFNGDISVEKSKGPLNLSSISGDIEVRNVEQADGGDGLDVKSVSGEVSLSDCKFGRVDASSVTGDLVWTGALSNGGQYKFATTNGDIVLTMPANSSFRVSAQAAARGAISTDFAFRSQGETSFDKITQSVTGVYGSGSAQLELTTFNGTIRLRKK